MAEYIDRQAAIVRACKQIKDDSVAHDVKEAIKSIPAADVVERKKGHWILRLPADQDNNATWECSVCHAGEVHVPIVEVPFCWKCGADMRGEQDER